MPDVDHRSSNTPPFTKSSAILVSPTGLFEVHRLPIWGHRLSVFVLPVGAPLPAAPPCILHLRFPRTAGDWHKFPLRARAPHRGARFMGEFSDCIGLFPGLLITPTPGGDGTSDPPGHRHGPGRARPRCVAVPCGGDGPGLRSEPRTFARAWSPCFRFSCRPSKVCFLSVAVWHDGSALPVAIVLVTAAAAEQLALLEGKISCAICNADNRDAQGRRRFRLSPHPTGRSPGRGPCL